MEFQISLRAGQAARLAAWRNTPEHSPITNNADDALATPTKIATSDTAPPPPTNARIQTSPITNNADDAPTTPTKIPTFDTAPPPPSNAPIQTSPVTANGDGEPRAHGLRGKEDADSTEDEDSKEDKKSKASPPSATTIIKDAHEKTVFGPVAPPAISSPLRTERPVFGPVPPPVIPVVGQTLHACNPGSAVQDVIHVVAAVRPNDKSVDTSMAVAGSGPRVAFANDAHERQPCFPVVPKLPPPAVEQWTCEHCSSICITAARCSNCHKWKDGGRKTRYKRKKVAKHNVHTPKKGKDGALTKKQKMETLKQTQNKKKSTESVNVIDHLFNDGVNFQDDNDSEEDGYSNNNGESDDDSGSVISLTLAGKMLVASGRGRTEIGDADDVKLPVTIGGTPDGDS